VDANAHKPSFTFAGTGHATLPLASAQKLKAEGKPSPGDSAFAAGHQPAYATAAAQAFTRLAITAPCLMHCQKKRPKKP
jgi:hypothetical protein